MFEKWKKHCSFIDDVNIITKLVIAVILFFFVIFVHQFDYMLYITCLILVLLLIFNGLQFKVTFIFIVFTILFSLVSALFMIFYGDGTHVLFKLGFIQITTESLFRGLHLAMRTTTVSFFGILIAFTSQIVLVFYSLMQHLKVKPKVAYAFMAAIRMVPLMIISFLQLRKSLKIRYQLINAQNYRGIKRLKHLIIPLLSQNIKKAHQLSVAMEKKGFKDGPRTYYYHAPFSYKDFLLIIVVGFILISAYYLALYFPITGIDDVRITSIY
ncbi:energy-coupling factor transporter transmembrane component T family protein [Staphylococcus edaphicus]|uniref:Cobalt ABC transporter permease n=1 Tax=Staphylococcus edaphicus TaxID=1955013 RepID=A0A2C6WRZ7_9STAP|nr:energy-coupling factor transporter transmembrane component T [Staphylococcus edaphicus]PHK50564.1 cobalt ABC transporter permease [Staphylococcus edaphicus]UQW80762.1 energy-coupling factor transporter transmembrane protein EcfT [Staphylococcus edaphicus]